MDPLKQLNLPRQREFTQRAPLLRRFGALLIDILLLDLIVFASLSRLIVGVELHDTRLTAVAAVAGLLALAYFSLMEYLVGQSIGKMVLGLRTERVTLGKAFVRHIYFLPIAPFPLLLLVEPIYLLIKKQRLLEQLSGTNTVQVVS